MSKLRALAAALMLITLLAAGVSACSKSNDAASTPAQPSGGGSAAADATPTEPTQATASTKPTTQATTGDLEQDAKIFGAEFVQAFITAERTGDLAAIRTMVSPDCTSCTANLARLDEMHAAGAKVTGGEANVSEVRVTETTSEGDDIRLFDVTLEVMRSARTVTFDEGEPLKSDVSFGQVHLGLSYEQGQWLVAKWGD